MRLGFNNYRWIGDYLIELLVGFVQQVMTAKDSMNLHFVTQIKRYE